MINQGYKFRGGIKVGLWASSWPNGVLEVGRSSLILQDKMTGKEYTFLKQDIVRIEVKKVFPIIGSGIQLHHTNKNYDKKIYFWYLSFRFNKLIDALKEFGWLR